MRKTIALIACIVISGCREAEVTSTSYMREDGTAAFSIQRYAHGFTLQGLDSSGRPSLTLMIVGMCKSARLLWDGKGSVLFAHDGAEISYLADGFEGNPELAIGVCRIGKLGCELPADAYVKESIPVSCG